MKNECKAVVQDFIINPSRRNIHYAQYREPRNIFINEYKAEKIFQDIVKDWESDWDCQFDKSYVMRLNGAFYTNKNPNKILIILIKNNVFQASSDPPCEYRDSA
jgi:hypothetical protein